MKSLFLTGTDTGVGKTRVGSALAAAWSRAGRKIAVFKPVETGCSVGSAGLCADDALRLLAAAGSSTPVADACPYRYAEPASPDTAARLAGLPPPELSVLRSRLGQLARGADLVLIEGAGGLLVPLSPGVTMADLVHVTGALLLIVARTSLGTINHTLLTIEAARHRRLPLAGVVYNQCTPPVGPEEPFVPFLIERESHVRSMGVLPWVPDPLDREQLADLARKHLDLEALWDTLQSSG